MESADATSAILHAEFRIDGLVRSGIFGTKGVVHCAWGGCAGRSHNPGLASSGIKKHVVGSSLRAKLDLRKIRVIRSILINPSTEGLRGDTCSSDAVKASLLNRSTTVEFVLQSSSEDVCRFGVTDLAVLNCYFVSIKLRAGVREEVP